MMKMFQRRGGAYAIQGGDKLNCMQVRYLFLLVELSIFFLFLVTYPFLLVCWLFRLLIPVGYSLIFVTHPPGLLSETLLVVKLQPIQTFGLDLWLLRGQTFFRRKTLRSLHVPVKMGSVDISVTHRKYG